MDEGHQLVDVKQDDAGWHVYVGGTCVSTLASEGEALAVALRAQRRGQARLVSEERMQRSDRDSELADDRAQ